MPAAPDLKRVGGSAIDAVLFDEHAIAKRVDELGAEITGFYPERSEEHTSELQSH